MRYVERKGKRRMESSRRRTNWLEKGFMLENRLDPYTNGPKNMLQTGLVAKKIAINLSTG